ncbi:MAG: TerC family protein [Verrucomicrobiales bacterium]|nr:TerC family protein [Verrucomicrobiales bacterium]
MFSAAHPEHWLAFTAFVLLALGLDLGVFHRKSHRVGFREALGWTAVWTASAMVFAFVAAPRWIQGWGSTEATSFVTGYVVELSLSMDNVFVIAVIFRYFHVPESWQHRVLIWGILGALVMRAVMILAGAAVIHRYHWTLYLMGAFLVYTGVKMLRSSGGMESVDPEHNPVVRLVRRLVPLAPAYDEDRFFTIHQGRRMLTPLALVLVVVETTDVVFALDSIPAIFGVTSNAFIVFTSNVFAILGLRSLYFVLASLMGYFRLLKYGLAIVLVFIGVKMLADHWLKAWLGDYLVNVSLGFVIGTILTSMLASVILGVREQDSPDGKAS